MDTNTLTRQIKIHCPQHHSNFDVAENPKIICTIREHALSNDFPRGEFWEYCCDCQIFSPSDLEVGGKGKDACPQCERPTVRRFICDECKVVSYDSGEETKGKLFYINSETGTINAACPGCLKEFSGSVSNRHNCGEIKTVLYTTRETCPFCQKTTGQPAKKKTPPAALPKAFCENCGTGINGNGVLCANCEQALKIRNSSTEEKTLVLPSMPAETRNFDAGETLISPTPEPDGSKKPRVILGLVIFGGLFLVIIFAVSVSQRTPNDNSNRGSIYNDNYNSSTPYPTSTPYNNSPASTYLPSSFERDYRGTIGTGSRAQSLSMSLKRTDSKLEGTASTTKTDRLVGTIDNDGAFSLKGYENGSMWKGNYNGRIYSDGSITGSWTNLDGEKSTPFSLEEE